MYLEKWIRKSKSNTTFYFENGQIALVCTSLWLTVVANYDALQSFWNQPGFQALIRLLTVYAGDLLGWQLPLALVLRLGRGFRLTYGNELPMYESKVKNLVVSKFLKFLSYFIATTALLVQSILVNGDATYFLKVRAHLDWVLAYSSIINAATETEGYLAKEGSSTFIMLVITEIFVFFAVYFIRKFSLVSMLLSKVRSLASKIQLHLRSRFLSIVLPKKLLKLGTFFFLLVFVCRPFIIAWYQTSYELQLPFIVKAIIGLHKGSLLYGSGLDDNAFPIKGSVMKAQEVRGMPATFDTLVFSSDGRTFVSDNAPKKFTDPHAYDYLNQVHNQKDGIRNVIHIMLESVRGDLFHNITQSRTHNFWLKEEVLNGSTPLTPNLDRMRKDMSLVDEPYSYTTAGYTIKARLGMQCGIHPYPGGMTVEHSTTFYRPCLPYLLRQNKFSTIQFHTGHYRFDHGRQVLDRTGFEEFYDETVLEKDPKLRSITYVNYFGRPDHILLKNMLKWIDKQQSNGKGFMLSLSTLVTHYPFSIPPEWEYRRFLKDSFDFNQGNHIVLTDMYYNSVHYMDQVSHSIIRIDDFFSSLELLLRLCDNEIS